MRRRQFQSCRTLRKSLSVVEIKSSCGEVRSQFYVALDQEYIDQKAADSLLIILKRLSVMIKHLIVTSNEVVCVAQSMEIQTHRVPPKHLEHLEPLQPWNFWNTYYWTIERLEPRQSVRILEP